MSDPLSHLTFPKYTILERKFALFISDVKQAFLG